MIQVNETFVKFCKTCGGCNHQFDIARCHRDIIEVQKTAPNKSSIKFPNVKELLDEVTFPSWLTSKAEFFAGFDQACVIIKRKLHT